MARLRKSTVDLAEVLEISQSSASRRTLGLTPFSLDEAAKAAAWLGFPLSELLGRAEQIASRTQIPKENH